MGDITTNAGIYAIKNSTNGRSYVGSSNNLLRRWTEHRKRLRAKRHDCPALQNAWNKYGEAAFTFTVVQELPGADDPLLLSREQFYLDTTPNLYNACLTAGKPPSTKGRKLRPRTPEHCQRIADSKKHLSKEARENLRNAQLGKKACEETRESMRAARLGQPGPFSGHSHSKRSKLKISRSVRLQIQTKETVL